MASLGLASAPMSSPTVVNPTSLAKPRGYSNGLAYTGGQVLFVAGQIGWDKDGTFVSSGFVDQFAQALRNVVAVVREAGGKPEHIGRLTLYVTDRDRYTEASKQLGKIFRDQMEGHYPTMSLLVVAGLLERQALVEIEATAVLP